MIRLENISKRYKFRYALKDVNLEFNNSVGILGPNGAGKTTLLSIIAGLVHPTKGFCERKGSIGILPQDEKFENEKVADLLDFFSRVKEEPVFDLVRELSLHDVLSYKIGNLSHGKRKLVGILIAFLGYPDIILLDEPFSGLDPEMTYLVKNLIRKRKSLYVISSHEVDDLLSVCNEIIYLTDGQIVYSGPPKFSNSFEIGCSINEKALPDLKKISGVEDVRLEGPVVLIDASKDVFAPVIRKLLSKKVDVHFIRRQISSEY